MNLFKPINIAETFHLKVFIIYNFNLNKIKWDITFSYLNNYLLVVVFRHASFVKRSNKSPVSWLTDTIRIMMSFKDKIKPCLPGEVTMNLEIPLLELEEVKQLLIEKRKCDKK